MHHHEPADYHCPFCHLPPDREPDVVYRDERVFALICPQWWPRNAGHLLIIPLAHHENLYDLPTADGHAVFDATRTLAHALRTAYDCAGVSTRQHNEPAGDQHVWHFHQHLFPRYPGDDLYATPPQPDRLPADRRHAYAARLRAALNSQAAGV
ncbi:MULTISPECIES: HIT family protein [unclassified Streptomyces]|uniref:HIT family protein n=1 Tax=unclassified Streptomyces TaxID=2593676 RepID=UPI0019075E00|nr:MULTISPECIES: HIT family protein [unclassified Streptomyces]MCU4746281.1 HIT family protein [Streptomyces sp. G-5]QQN76581.1 HIT family protein [Streptomyces sp. XC 2026]